MNSYERAAIQRLQDHEGTLERQRERYHANADKERARARDWYQRNTRTSIKKSERYRERARDQTRAVATRKNARWTVEEDQMIILGELSLRDIALATGRTYDAVKSRKRDLYRELVQQLNP